MAKDRMPPKTATTPEPRPAAPTKAPVATPELGFGPVTIPIKVPIDPPGGGFHPQLPKPAPKQPTPPPPWDGALPPQPTPPYDPPLPGTAAPNPSGLPDIPPTNLTPPFEPTPPMVPLIPPLTPPDIPDGDGGRTTGDHGAASNDGAEAGEDRNLTENS